MGLLPKNVKLNCFSQGFQARQRHCSVQNLLRKSRKFCNKTPTGQLIKKTWRVTSQSVSNTRVSEKQTKSQTDTPCVTAVAGGEVHIPAPINDFDSKYSSSRLTVGCLPPAASTIGEPSFACPTERSDGSDGSEILGPKT